MELNFENRGGLWEAEVEVNDDYNVHVECEGLSDVVVRQRTAGDKFADVHSYKMVDVMDDDFDAIVYPKTVRVTSTQRPVAGIITEAQ